MRYYLMHKNKVVLAFVFDKNYDISEIHEIFNENHIPIDLKEEGITPKKLGIWWNKRCFSENRDGYKRIMKYLKLKNFKEVTAINHGLSLNDKYWIKKENESVSWDKINFYNNRFSYDIGNIIFGDRHLNPDDIDFFSPDITTNGKLRKAWRIKDNERYLIKSGSHPYLQEPVNEKIASKMLKKLNFIPFVEYELTLINKDPCSVCKNFLDENTEFISAYTIYKTKPRDPKTKVYDHLLERCDYFKISGVREFINNMLIADMLIVNTDRHLGNFGFLRDSETLKFIGPAPLFDNGTSLWNLDHTTQIKNVLKVSRPFEGLWSDQIKLIKNMKGVDLSVLKDFSSVIEELLKKDSSKKKVIQIPDYDERINMICNEFQKNFEEMERFQETLDKKEHCLHKENIEIEENIGL